MVNVPPLFCSTPPPLDVIDDDNEIENDGNIDTMPTLSPIHHKKLNNTEYIDSMPPLPDTFNESTVHTNDYHEINFDNNVKYIQSSPPATPSTLDLKLYNKVENDSSLPQDLSVEVKLQQIIETKVKSHIDTELESITNEEKGNQGNEISAHPNADTYLEPLSKLNVSSATISSHKVFIEDIENDASEDELYSPTILTNFTEVDVNSKNYFIIESVHKSVENSSNKDNLPQSFSISQNNSTNKLNENAEVLQQSATRDELSKTQSEEANNSINDSNRIDNAGNSIHNVIDDENGDEFGDFNTFQQQSDAIDHRDGQHTKPIINPDKILKTFSKELFDSNTHMKSIEEKEDKENFTHFTLFTNSLIYNSIADENVNDIDDLAISANNGNSKHNDEANDDDDDDDDEFGDFNTAEPIATSCISLKTDAQQQQQQQQKQESTDIQLIQQSTITSQKCAEGIIPVISKNSIISQQEQQQKQQHQLNCNHNLKDRISKILVVMFPTTSDVEKCDVQSEMKYSNETFKRHKLNNIPFASVDSAKALEFQWSNSQSRQTFIQSLGMDFRNILFGDNWNPTLPRYAANLSFNPLRPVKMTTETEMSNNQNNNNNNNNITSEKDEQCDKNMVDIQWKSCITAASNKKQQQQEQHYDVLNEKPTKIVAMPELRSTSNIIDNDDADKALPIHALTEHLEIVVDQYNECSMELNDMKYTNLNELDKIATSPASQVSTHSPCEQISNINIDSLEFSEVNADINVITSPNATDTIMSNSSNKSNNGSNSTDTCDVMATSTYTGSFKETHIFTPSKSPDTHENRNGLTPTKTAAAAAALDFDYKKAAMGVIIDETVVKKEYRDIVYEPEFSLDHLVDKMANNDEKCSDLIESKTMKVSSNYNNENENDYDYDDEFTDFQSVTSNDSTNAVIKSSSTPNSSNVMLAEFNAAKSVHGMILSPAILLPQAIPFDVQQQTTQIEWGDSVASINPEELARIEELFPEPKLSMSMKSASTSNSSQKSTPTHMASSSSSSLSISATVAQREQREQVTNAKDNVNDDNDEDDWSEFVSVPINNVNTQQQQQQQQQQLQQQQQHLQNSSIKNNSNYNNNNHHSSTSGGSGLITTTKSITDISSFSNRPQQIQQQQQQRQVVNLTKITQGNQNTDEEWSDFVSSALPTSTAASATYKPNLPQFNSGAWQNANYYNNPLSLYHKGPINISSTYASHSPKHLINNNNNYNNNNVTNSNNNNYPVAPTLNNYHSTRHMRQLQQQQQQQQQIHVMQNFSTISMPTNEHVVAATAMARNTQLQMGAAKVAPSIALIPDLGFIAPAIPTHTSFINSLPRPSLNTKK